MDADDLARGRALVAGLDSPTPWASGYDNKMVDASGDAVVVIEAEDHAAMFPNDLAAVVWLVNHAAALLDAAERAARLEASVARYEEALQFYADYKSYGYPYVSLRDGSEQYRPGEVDHDRGRRAVAALARPKGAGDE